MRLPIVLHSNSFRKTLLATISAEIGVGVYFLALPLAVFSIRHDYFDVDVSRAIAYVPNVVLGLLIGSIVDSASKRNLAVIASLLQAVCAMGLAVCISYIHGKSFPSLLLIFAGATMAYLYANNQASIIRRSVGPELITSAQSLIGSAIAIVSLCVSPLAGWLITLIGSSRSLVVTGVFFMICALICSRIEVENPAGNLNLSAISEKARRAVKILRANSNLRKISLCTMFSNAALGAFDINLLILLIQLHYDPRIIGVVLSAKVLGGLGGSVAVVPLSKRFSELRLLVLATLGGALSYAALNAFTSLLPIMAAVLCVGFCIAMFNITIYSYRQKVVPQESIGAVIGLTGSVFKFALPVSVYLAGVIAQRFGVRYAFLFATLLALIAAVTVAGDQKPEQPNEHLESRAEGLTAIGSAS